MNSLHTLFRWMMLAWLALVLALGVVVARSTHTAYPGNAMAFLFSSMGRESADIAPVQRPLPVLRAETPPEPGPEPEPQPVPVPEWAALAVGTTKGSGAFGEPQFAKLPDENAFAVTFPFTGEPGDIRFYTPRNVTGMSVDFIGTWSKPPLRNRRNKTGVVARVQMAGHDGYFRVSGIAEKGVGALSARAEYSQLQHAVRVVFAPVPAPAKPAGK